jgi:hypothetical protein
MTAEKIRVGIKLTLADITERGWLAETCLINPDETAVPTVERQLAASSPREARGHALRRAIPRGGRPLCQDGPAALRQREISFSQGVKWKALISAYIGTIPLSGDMCVAAEHEI